MTVNLANPGLRILPADIPSPQSGRSAGSESVSFGQQLEQAVSDVDRQGREAVLKVSSMLEGGGTDVHDAMISVQKADLSFQLMLQVRNKVVQAYQEIERMQF